MEQAVGRGPFILKGLVRPRPSLCEINGRQRSNVAVFHRVWSTSGIPVSAIPPVLHTYSFFYQMRAALYYT
jgi:hypothetical protein